MSSKVNDWLYDFFSKRGNDLSQDNFGSKNYFHEGWIDSLGIILLIEEAEEKFSISFSQEHFQDRRFSTIDGLSSIIGQLLKVKEPHDNN